MFNKQRERDGRSTEQYRHKADELDEVEAIIKSGDSDLLRIVFETGQFNDINAMKSFLGPSLLMIACQTGFIDCVKVLLDYKNGSKTQYDCLLLYACLSGKVEMVRFIIENGFEINDTAIMDVFETEVVIKNTEIITILIDYIKIIDLPFLFWASHAGNVTIVQSLLERGANPNSMYCSTEFDALFGATKKGYYEVVKLLLTWDAIDKRPSQDRLVGALVRAAYNGHIDIALYIFEYGIEVTAAALTSALRAAVENNHLQIADYLIAKGVEYNIPTMNDACLLTYPCIIGSMVRLLLTRGADPNAVDHHGCCPLKAALHYADIVNLVLEAGADPNLHFADGSTALIDVIKSFEKNARVILHLLFQHGADPNLAHAHTAETPLMAAARGHPRLALVVVGVLLKHGADVTQLNIAGKCFLDMICAVPGMSAMVELYRQDTRPSSVL